MAAQLGPDHVVGHAAASGRGVEAAIGARHHPVRIADHACDHALDPVGHHFGMLDEVGQRIDHAGDDHLVRRPAAARSRQRYSCAWRGLAKGSTKPPTLAWRIAGRMSAQRHVAVVRRLVVAPADVHAHPVARHVDQRGVDRRHHPLGEVDEVGQRPVLVGDVPFQRQVRRVDLQQEAGPHDGFVFDLQRLRRARRDRRPRCRSRRCASPRR